MLDTDSFYELSSPNLFIFEGSLVRLAVQVMNGVPSRNVTSRFIPLCWKKSSNLRNCLSIIASQCKNSKCLNISAQN